MSAPHALPWYREPWPWLLMAAPAAAVVAGLVTAWLAFSGADALVAEDYYKQGLAVNRVLAREERARALGLSARIALADGRVRVSIDGAAPASLELELTHRTRAGVDRRLRLARVGDRYEAAAAPLEPGRWRAAIEPPDGAWRLRLDVP